MYPAVSKHQDGNGKNAELSGALLVNGNLPVGRLPTLEQEVLNQISPEVALKYRPLPQRLRQHTNH